MENKDIVIIQYQTLRREIEFTKDRIFKILSAGIIIVTVILPGARALALSFSDLDAILVAVPLVIILYALFFVSETRALMRAGRYIRKEIEEKHFDFQGWESWIEDHRISKREKNYRRSHDVILFWSFIALCFISYIFSAWYAYLIFINQFESAIVTGIFIGFYATVGVLSLFWAIFYSQVSTTSDDEDYKVQH